MRAFKGLEDALEPRTELERLHHLVVLGIGKLDPFLVAIKRGLRPDCRGVESRAHRVRQLDLPIRILEDVSLAALQHAELAAFETRRVLAARDAAAAGLDADHPHAFVLEEFEEKTD